MVLCCASYDQLSREKEAVEQEYILYRKELKHTSVGVTTKVCSVQELSIVGLSIVGPINSRPIIVGL